jgi:hypothetical protein
MYSPVGQHTVSHAFVWACFMDRHNKENTPGSALHMPILAAAGASINNPLSQPLSPCFSIQTPQTRPNLDRSQMRFVILRNIAMPVISGQDSTARWHPVDQFSVESIVASRNVILRARRFTAAGLSTKEYQQ